MHIAIDARAISHPQPGGFKSYTTNLVQALLETDQTNRYTLYFDRPVEDDLWRRHKNASLQTVAPPQGWLGMPVREQLLLARRLRAARPEIVHFPCATGALFGNCPAVVTIHDAIALLEKQQSFPTTRENLRRILMSQYVRWVQTLIARRATAVITDSSYSKRDLVNVLHVDPTRIRVIPLAQAHHFNLRREQTQLADLRNRYPLPPMFVLALASASPRKNASGLLRIYAKLPLHLRKQFPLVLVWTHNLLQAQVEADIEQLGLQGTVISVQRVTDSDLALLYHAATVFVFPSLYEGFGLPVLEAMACGTPVVSSNRTSIPEVAGSAAVLVDPSDEVEFAEHLEELLVNPQRRMELTELGRNHAARFSWRQTAEMTLEVYREAALGA